MTYKVVCNTVTPEPIPSKSRLGSADGTKVGFLQRIISIIGAYSDLGRDTLYVAVLRQLFVLSHSWRRVRTLHDVGIPIRLRVEIPQGPILPMPVPLKSFSAPPNSSTCLPCHDNRNPGSLHPRDVHSNSAASVHSLQSFRKATPQKQKRLNPLDSVEDVKLRIRDRFLIPRIDSFQRVGV